MSTRRPEIPPCRFYGGADSAKKPRAWRTAEEDGWSLHAQQQTALREASESGEVPWAVEIGANGRRKFIVASRESFWRRYRRLRPQFRHHYEVVAEGQPCHLYLDLEFYVRANPDRCGEAMTLTVRREVCAALHREYGVLPPDDAIVELDSSTAAKFSRHLVVRLPGAAFADNGHCGRFVRAWVNELAARRAAEPALNALWVRPASAGGSTPLPAEARSTPLPVAPSPPAGSTPQRRAPLYAEAPAAVQPSSPPSPSDAESDASRADDSPISRSRKRMRRAEARASDCRHGEPARGGCAAACAAAAELPGGWAEGGWRGAATPPAPLASLHAPCGVGVAAASFETTFVDLGVYTRNRCFRLYKSSKLAGQAELRPARLSAAEQATLPGHFLDTSWTLEGSLPQSRPSCRTPLLL